MNKIKELREKNGMKQAELGQLLSVNNSAISKYESGKLQLTDETLVKLSNIFGVSIDYILCHTSNNETSPCRSVLETDISPEEQFILDIYNQDPNRIAELLKSFCKLSERNKTIVLGKCYELENEDEKSNTEKLNKEKDLKQAT